MKCYLIQHGDALAEDVDPDRALSAAGRADVERLAAFLGKTEPAIARVLHSGKTRARQTAEILAAMVAPAVEVEAVSGIDPMDDVEAFARTLMTWNDNVMVVGHLPFHGKLVSRLVLGRPHSDLVSFLPGSMACLERADERWAIVAMVRPELLKARST